PRVLLSSPTRRSSDLNAFLIVVCKIPDLLATLGMMFVIQGAMLIPVSGMSVSSGMIMPDGSTAPGKFDPTFLAIDRGMVGPIPRSEEHTSELQSRFDL